MQYVSLRFKLRLRKTYPHGYHRFLCKLFGVRVAVIGKPIQDRGVLMVANHTGYFDVLIMSASARVSCGLTRRPDPASANLMTGTAPGTTSPFASTTSA